jgi:DNA-binding NarL/FixJ family response regulator
MAIAGQFNRKGKTMNPHNEMTVQFGSLAHSEPRTRTPDSGNPMRVWLVDDNHEFRGLLALLLADEGGFDCSREFPSAKAMLDALACETPPEVILLDIQMREECGLDAIRPIRSLAASTHVLMLTTCYDSIYRKRALRDGATDYLLKSYSVEQIAHHIQKAVEQPVPSGLVSVFPERALERVEISAGVSSGGEDERAADFTRGRFSKHDLSEQNSDRRWHTVWRGASNRLLRGAFYVRSWLAMFY